MISMSGKNGIKIAISGKSGCGNTTTSGKVAEQLNLRLINYTFHSIAEEKGMSFKELHDLAEKDTSWDKYLDRRQVEMASEGNCVLGSRLAIWVLKDADLKVYLRASRDVRAKRIQKREGGDGEKVMLETEDRDRRDRERYLKLYGIDNDEFLFADLVINTDELSVEQVAEIIVAAARIKLKAAVR